jgi:outer membrane murein-binding lipoprotein Lpp
MRWRSRVQSCYWLVVISQMREQMRKASLAVVAFGLLGVAACNRSNPDQLNADATNQSLDDLSNDAANLAAESQVLENQAAQLNQEAQSADNAAGAQTANDEEIQGM